MHIASLYLPLEVGLVRATGADAPELLHRLSTQETKSLGLALQAARPGAARPEAGPAPLPTGLQLSRPLLLVNHQGRLIAAATALASPGALTLVTRAGGAAELQEWLLRYTITEDAEFSAVNESFVCWRLLTAWPAGLVGRLGSAEASGAENTAETAYAAGAPWAQVAEVLAPLGAAWWPVPRGWGEGYDILLPAPKAAPAAELLAALGLRPAPEANAFALARLLVGEPAWQLDYPSLAPPLEWRLGQGTIDWHKGCFVGQEVLSRLDSYNKVARLVMGVEAGPAAAALCAKQNALKVVQGGVPVGRLASWAPLPPGPGASPLAPGCIALALVRKEAARPGPCHLVAGEGGGEAAEPVPASLVDRPFWL